MTTMPDNEILLVDDDPGLRSLLELELRALGYGVHAYDSAESALASAPAKVDLAVLDYRLPGMDGITLYSRLRARAPDLPVLIISSDCTAEVVATSGSPRPPPLLRKPFARQAFVSRVRALLDRG